MQVWQGESKAKTKEVFEEKLESGRIVMEHDGTNAKASFQKRG